MMTDQPPVIPEAFWRLEAGALAQALGCKTEGLSRVEAESRLNRFGPNSVETPAPFRFLRMLARRASEPLVLILAICALLSGLAGDMVGFWMILAILAVSIVMDVVQEYRAGAAAEALRHAVAVHADVLRDGTVVPIPSQGVVPGDIVQLRAGDLVPADGVVIEARDLHANQAALTGEPFPAAKDGTVAASDDLSEATNALFSGSSIVSGSGRMLVVATGARTRFGAIAGALAGSEAPTAFERDMRVFGMLIVKLTGALVVLVLAAHLAFSRPLLDSVLFALALAVGLTPSLLPMIMTVSLSKGALRLAKGGVIVKRLSALHTLGAIDVFCTDKTGTLTEAKIAMQGALRGDGAEDAEVSHLAYLNSTFESGVRSVLDDAVLQYQPVPDIAGWRKIDEAPFDFERRRVSVLAENAARRILITKGAPEDVLAHCVAMENRDGSIAPLDAAALAQLMALHDKLANEGLRLLAVAFRAVDATMARCTPQDETDLTFAGYAVFLDPPKASAGEALRALKKAGVALKVISGDNELVVRHIAKALGLPSDHVLTGQDVARLDEPALRARAGETDLFCRVDPIQKRRIILALQGRGRVVGYLGDGINDAPSLQAADVGISVDGAVDVARQAADLILTKPDLGLVAAGIAEGRRTFSNIMKYIRMGTSSNFGNMVSMALASLFLPFLPMLPVQILFNNLLYDASEMGIPFDSVEKDEQTHPQHWDMRALRRFTFVMGLLSSVFDIATFTLLMKVFHAPEALFRTAWFMESMATQILVIFVIRTRAPFRGQMPHPALSATSLGALVLALITPFTPLGAVLGFVPIDAKLAGALAGLVIFYLLLAEGLKRVITPHRPSRKEA